MYVHACAYFCQPMVTGDILRIRILTTLKEKRNASLIIIFLKFLPEFCEIKCMCLNPTYVLDILAQ